MTHTPNELADAFPGREDKIHALKASNGHFAKLAEAYHALNREVHRMETGIEPVADDILETEKKKRLKLLDEIGAMIAAA